MCVDLYILERNAAGSLESGERDRSLQEPIPLPAQQGSSRGVRFWRALFSLGHRVDNLKDPFRNSDLSCMYWSAVKGHEVSIETAETFCNQLAMAGHRFCSCTKATKWSDTGTLSNTTHATKPAIAATQQHSFLMHGRVPADELLQWEQVSEIDFGVFISCQKP